MATPEEALLVALTFKGSGEVTALLDKQPETAAKEVKYLDRAQRISDPCLCVNGRNEYVSR